MTRIARVVAKLVDRALNRINEGEDRLAGEWADAVGLCDKAESRLGPEVAIFSVASTLDHFVRAAEDGAIENVPLRVVEENRRILRIFRDEMTADEREHTDRMVAKRYADFLRELPGPGAGGSAPSNEGRKE